MVNKKRFLKLLLLVSALSLALLVRNSDLVRVQAIGGDDVSVYLPIAIKPEPTPTATPTLTPTATPTVPASSGPNEADFDLVLRVASSGADSSSCGAENNPCSTIQQAVDLAQGSTVNKILLKVAQGTYTGAGKAVVTLASDFPNLKSITIVGGYTSSNWSSTTLQPNDTIIEGQAQRRGVYVRNGFNPVEIQGITIQNGLMTDSLLYDGKDVFFGGGLSCVGTTVMLSQVTFKNNVVRRDVAGSETVGGGGAGFYFNCPATLTDVIFDGNQAIAGNAPDNTRGGIAQGGGLLASEGSPINATNITFTNNKAIAGSGGVGQDSTRFWLADALGGGASLQLNTVVIDGITATGNEVMAGQGSSFGGAANGGALFFELNIGTVVIKNGTMRDNKVTGGASPTGIGGVGGGGGIMSTDSTLSLENLGIVNNQAYGGTASDGGDAGGGAMYFTTGGGQPSVVEGTNLILTDNVAEGGEGKNRYGGGGAVFSQDTTLTLNHATIARNRILNSMQGLAIVSLHNVQDATYNTTINFSIVSDHENYDIFDNPIGSVIAQRKGDNLTLQSVLFHNNTPHYSSQACAECGQYYGWQWWDPAGPPVFTVSNLMEGDPAYVSSGSPNFNYHITADSAARDKAVGSTTTTDIDGGSRPVGNAPDLGADEYDASLK